MNRPNNTRSPFICKGHDDAGPIAPDTFYVFFKGWNTYASTYAVAEGVLARFKKIEAEIH